MMQKITEGREVEPRVSPSDDWNTLSVNPSGKDMAAEGEGCAPPFICYA